MTEGMQTPGVPRPEGELEASHPIGAPLPPPTLQSAVPPVEPKTVPSNSVVSALASLADEALAKIGDGVDVDSVGDVLEWWYRPFVSQRTWMAFGSLFVGAIWGPLMFAAVVVVASVVFSLTFAFVGLLLVVPAFGVINAIASVERRRAGWVGDPIPPPHFDQPSGGILSPIVTRLGDAARWRQVVFFAVFLIIAPVLFVIGLLPWTFLLRLIFGTDFDPTSFNFGGLLLAAVLAGAAPRVTIGAAWVGRSFTEALLGPNEAVELQERVTELSDQRQQILEAVADERRRIERNLHDGVQQQLVALGIDIGRARARLSTDPDGASDLLDAARDKVRGSIGELRLIGRGLNPAVLDDRGLDAALSAVVSKSSIPITVVITTDVKLDDDIAATAYYVANEAVANLLKHARARVASIKLEDDVTPGRVRLTIHDDGRGGADARQGTGLAGMRARVEGVDGQFLIDSPVGGPTRLVAVLPTTSQRPSVASSGGTP